MRKIGLLIFALASVFRMSAQTDILSKNNGDSISSYVATLLEDIDMRILKIETSNRYNSIQQRISIIF